MNKTQTFIPASQVLPGDRLTKHGVTVTSVETNDRGEIVFGYAHTDVKGVWFPTRKFHVTRGA